MTDSWRISADVIGDTGREVLTDGGFSGHVPVFTVAQINRLVRSGAERLSCSHRRPRGPTPWWRPPQPSAAPRYAAGEAAPTDDARTSTNPFGDQAGASFTLERCS